MNWYAYRRDAFAPYLSDRCPCGTLYPLSLHTQRTQICKELTDNPGQKEACSLCVCVCVWCGVWGCCWSLDEKISLQLLHFVVPAQEAQCQQQRADILWYIVREDLGQNAKHSRWKSDILFKVRVGDTQKPAPAFPKQDLKIYCLFPKMMVWFIERCGAKAS